MSKQSFIKEISSHAVAIQKKHRLLPSLIIAQACLESGFGSSRLAKEGKNLFGIKGTYNGSFVEMNTKEWDRKTGWFSVKAKFRKYPSWQDSIEDHALLFVHGLSREKSNRYKALIGETDYKKASMAVKTAGYATNPDYPQLLNRIIEQYNLTQYDNHVKHTNSSATPHSYTVKQGDTLATISHRYGTTVQAIARENRIDYPDLIFPGQLLSLPISEPEYYHVQKGDTLSEIAAYYNTTAARLADLNQLTDPDRIYPGQKIHIK